MPAPALARLRNRPRELTNAAGDSESRSARTLVKAKPTGDKVMSESANVMMIVHCEGVQVTSQWRLVAVNFFFFLHRLQLYFFRLFVIPSEKQKQERPTRFHRNEALHEITRLDGKTNRVFQIGARFSSDNLELICASCDVLSP